MLGPLFEALSSTSADLTRLKIVCDWIQYGSSFAEPVRCRPVLAERPTAEDAEQGCDDPGAEPKQAAAPAISSLELALDLRRC
jgi:hypothetical protein